MKILLIVVLIIIGLFLLFTFGGGYYMYRFATLRNKKQRNYWKDEMKPAKFLSEEDNQIILNGWKYLRAQNWEDVDITSHDGLKLHGHFLAHPNPRGVILQIHGYRGCGAFDFSCAAEPFYNLGFSLLFKNSTLFSLIGFRLIGNPLSCNHSQSDEIRGQNGFDSFKPR